MPNSKETDKKIVLLVESQLELRHSLQEMMISWDYRVVATDSIQNAIQKTANQKFNLILLDLAFHKISALKLLEQIRRSDLNMNYFTPLIIHSDQLEVDIFYKYKGEFNDALIKPSSIDTIKAKIDYWVQRKHNCKKYNLLFINKYNYKQHQDQQKLLKKKTS